MKNLLLSLIIGLTAMGCREKEDEYNPKLPPITQHGANTFGAVINGKVMVPREGGSCDWVFGPCSNNKSVSYMYTSNYESFRATDRQATKRGGIYIYMENTNNNNPIFTGSYSFNDSNGSSPDVINPKPKGIMMNCYLGGVLYLSIANTGSITITRNDTEVISGTFSCKLRNKDNPNDVIEVKDGRFDFNKKTINSTQFK